MDLRSRARSFLKRPAVRIARETVRQFFADRAPRLGAALAYYALFSIAPLLLFSILVAGLLFDPVTVQDKITRGVGQLLGGGGGEAVEAMVEARNRPGQNLLSSLVGLVVLLVGAMGVFNRLQAAFDTIWDTDRVRRKGWKGFLFDRLFSLGMVLATTFLLLTSLVLTTMLSLGRERAQGFLPGSDALWTVLDYVLAFALVTLVFALLFRYMPQERPAWGHVWIGALLTAVLFTLGQALVGFYIARSAFAAAYGLASAVLALLIWMYYTALILFLGAEFTQVWADARSGPARARRRSEAKARRRTMPRGPVGA